MNLLQKGISLAVVAFAFFAVVTFVAPTAYAQEYEGCDLCGGDAGYTTYGYPDAGYTTYGYPDAGNTTYGYPDSGYTTYGYPDAGNTTYGYPDAGYTEYAPGYTEYAPGYTDYYEGSDGVMYSDGCGCTSGGSYGGGSYSGGSRSTGSFPFSFGSYTIGYPTGTPAPAPRPTTSTGGQTQNQSQSQSSANNNVNNNTNVNNVNVVVNAPTAAPVTPIYQTPIQYPVVYQQPVVYQPAPYCTISISNSGGYNNGYNQATLTWSASNATSAYISPSVGTVSTYGSRIVNPGFNQIYTMTVYGYNGQTASCQTTFYQTYVAPTTPYVSLSQIPYTGFDLGPIGNAIYWASLALFALAAGYLMIYFRGGALALAGSVFGSRNANAFSTDEVEEDIAAELEAEVTPEVEESTDGMNLAAAASKDGRATIDTMSVTPDGRLVITRN